MKPEPDQETAMAAQQTTKRKRVAGDRVKRITKRVVDHLEVKDHEYAAWDASLPGFGVRVRKSGAASYVVVYRHGTGKDAPMRRVTLGDTGKLTPDQARKVARKTLGMVAQGLDPAAAKRKAAEAAADTLRAVTEEYFRIECGMKRNTEGRAVFPENGSGKLRSARRRLAEIERLVYPKLGATPTGNIKRSDPHR